jgi:murein DD-endopeptidase MepM/ murein hydrolase activator NlpD
MKRAACAVSILFVVGLWTTSAPAGAQSTKTKLDQQRQRIAALKTQAGRIALAYETTEHQLNETRTNIAHTNADIKRAQAEKAALQDRLKDRVRAAYRMRGIGFFQFLLEARSFRDFNLRLINLQRTTLQDEDLILKLRKTQHELEIKQAELDKQEGVLATQKQSYLSQGRRLAISLQEQDRIFRALQGQLRREELARLFRTLRGVRGMVIPLDACPVAGPHNVTNSFGDPRGGGTRRHQGNDIMAPFGAPVVATVSGRITKTGSGGLGGIALYLFGGGTEFYYAHLSKLSVGAGQSVSAGQRIGANGNTGNARGGPPHVHFEIHPGGGRAIDPYPSLSRVC